MGSVNNIVNGNESYNGKNKDNGNGIDNVEIVNDDVFDAALGAKRSQLNQY